MTSVKSVSVILAALAIIMSGPARAQKSAPPPPAGSGVIRVKSSFGMDETLDRVKKDIAAKGLRFFDEIDQAKLATNAGIKLKPSVLMLFGNPPLGIQFLTASPYSALDWPVRMVVFEDDAGQVWIAYTDFKFIARRYHITNRAAQFKMAAEFSASVASSAIAKH